MFPSDRGNVAKPVRMALGSLLIQARCGYTDRETVQQIPENPYLQYFIGLKEYQLIKTFTPRIGLSTCRNSNDENQRSDRGKKPAPNQGILLLDVTCSRKLLKKRNRNQNEKGN